MLRQISGGLIVSCQPLASGPMDTPTIVAAMASCAVQGGAVAVRIEGVDNVKAVRTAVSAPIIGLVKHDLDDTPVRITPLAQHVSDLIAAGADMVALDFTHRHHPDTLESKVAIAKAANVPLMADCSCLKDARLALHFGVEILGTTLSGYVGDSVPEEPDLKLVEEFSKLGGFVIAEGRYNTPEKACQAMKVGADAVVVGTAITRIDCVTSWYRDAMAGCGHGK